MAAAPSESNDQLAAAPSTSTDPSCIWFVHTGNANQLLPPELLHLTLSLAKPTPSIPAVCSMFHSICSNGHDVYISWRNFVLLGDGWVIQDPNTLVMLSDLPEHLKSLIVGSSARTYSKATGFAPSQPARSDPVVTVKLLRQLYKSTLLRYSLKRGEIPEDERVDVDPESHMLAALDALFAPHLKNYHWWRPMTDALILPVYLLRASQLDQLDECLQYLLGSPMGRELTLATMTWASWQAICLDDRSETKHLFEGLAETQGKHRRAQYPIVLATLALLEWSLPMLHVVMRHFPSALTTLDIATFATSGYPRVFSSMLSLLGSSPSLPDSVDRIMDMHEWLEVHSGQRLVSPLASLCRPRTPLQYLEQVLIDIDIPRLRMAEQEHNEALSTAERKGIAECIGTVGSVELLSLVLNHGFALGLVEWVLLVTCDVQKWWVVLQQHVESKDEQCNVAFSGFWHAVRDSVVHSKSIPQYAHLLQTVLTSICLTWFCNARRDTISGK